ncbi:hypothetical protein AB0O28_04875 [Microbispora sp. NPDC088329]|uniref:hypothetical protein n=1 Tax=unclassified Microbispora TaxID=2614687 RepID=UPI00341E7D45
MNAAAWVAVVIVAVLVILAVGYLVSARNRRRHLQDRFGPEYERTVRESDSRREAEQDLRAREERHAKLDIRPLDPRTRDRYARKWTEVQERFVDAPGFAVTEADALVTAVMAERGYPTDDFEQRLSDLSVAHAATLDHYRNAHDISSRAARQDATTEELRQAMVHYRALFEELLGDGADAEVNGHVHDTLNGDTHVTDGYDGASIGRHADVRKAGR